MKPVCAGLNLSSPRWGSGQRGHLSPNRERQDRSPLATGVQGPQSGQGQRVWSQLSL